MWTGNIDAKIDREREVFGWMDGYSKLSEKFESRRPKIEDFKSDPDYAENKKVLESLKTRIDREDRRSEIAKKRGKIFENALIQESKLLFGEGAEAAPASQYDDYINGTDFVIEAPDPREEGGIVRFAVDATITNSLDIIKNKLRTNRDKIKAGARGLSVRYFNSTLEPQKAGRLSNIPKIIIGIDESTFSHFSYVLENGRKDAKTAALMREVFLKMVKSQLGNQLVYTIGVNGYKADTSMRRENLSPEKEKILKSIYEYGRLIANGLNDDKSFDGLTQAVEDNIEIYKEAALPEYVELLENIMAARRWALNELKKAEELKSKGIGVDPLSKEKVASIAEATVAKNLSQYWDYETFDLWPVFGRV